MALIHYFLPSTGTNVQKTINPTVHESVADTDLSSSDMFNISTIESVTVGSVVPGGLEFLLLQALLGLPVCSLLLKHASFFFELLVLSLQILFHLLMSTLKLQRHTQDRGRCQFFGHEIVTHAVQNLNTAHKVCELRAFDKSQSLSWYSPGWSFNRQH